MVDYPPRPPETDDDRPGADVRQLIAEILPENSSSRLSRMTGVNPRTAQKWIGGQSQVPDAVWDDLIDQRDLVRKYEIPARLRALLAEFEGVDNEIVASLLSDLYSEVTGQPIR